MKTIKLPYKTDYNLTKVLKQYSTIVRWSYNRFLKEHNEKDIRHLSKFLNNTDLLNSYMIQCAILDGKAIKKRFGNEKVIFGGKGNLLNRAKNKITKEEFNIKRLSPLTIQGEKFKKGNRAFKLDLENNQIIFKLNRTSHIVLKLPKLRNNINKELFKLQYLNEVKQNHKGYTFTVKLDLKYIYISFEELKDELVKLNQNRYLGIDLNPDTIGISILDNEQVIHAQEFSLKPIFDKILSSKLASSSIKMKYYQNKLKFETLEISKVISRLAKHFRCKSVYIEDLNFKQKLTKAQKRNHLGNRKNKNLWKKEKLIVNLTKRLNILGIELHKVNPAYTSFIGNLKYDYTDAINASIEIARRGYEYRIKKNKNGFYPSLSVKHQWKEMATDIRNWRELFLNIKNLKLKYRVSLNEVKYKFNVFSLNQCKRSMVLNYVFY